jgi:hypothetical protein
MSALFAERFAVAPDFAGDAATTYDEELSYCVTPSGTPYVETLVTASTNTQTYVRQEAGDSHRSAWETAMHASVGTRTSVRRDRDYW